MHSIDALALASRVESDLAFRKRLSHLGASLAPDRDFQPAPRPRRRHGWLSGLTRAAST
ncbi:MAG: hypothetical protein ACRDHF_18905 [Tepidiformaceae bacterium]